MQTERKPINPKRALATVFLVVMIDLLGFGIVLPLLPFYAGNFDAGPVEIGLLYSVYSLAQLLFSPIWGGLSDRIGRRPVMLISTFGGALAYIWFGLAGSLGTLFMARLMAGIMGGNLGAAQAYIADITTEDKRASGMALIGVAFGIGFVLGPALATGIIHPSFSAFFMSMGWPVIGEFIQVHRFELTGFFAAALSLGSFLMVWLFLPETVDTSVAAQSKTRRPSPISRSFWQGLIQSDGIVHVKAFRLLMISGFLLTFSQSSLYGAFPLFCEQVLSMTPEEVGVQFFYMGLISVVVQGGLIRVLTRYFREERVFLAGNILMTIGFLMLGFSQTAIGVTAWLAVMASGMSLNGPTLTSLASKQVDASRTGALLGMFQSISGLGRVIGPTWGGALFLYGPSLPFFLTGIILSVTIVAGVALGSAGRTSNE